MGNSVNTAVLGRFVAAFNLIHHPNLMSEVV